MRVIECDHLIVGAGASGMAVADELVAGSDAEVVLVDRRHLPGGHWLDAYPFVRLHQPSAYYGVNCRPLGGDRIDEHGPNAGMYERATGAEVCAHYQRALEDHLVPSGRVRFLGSTGYVGRDGDEHVLRSSLTGVETRVRARRRLVDATYVESVVPARHTPGFAVDDGARVVTPTALADLDGPARDFVVIGAGKTGMDVCCWLLDQGVDADHIRWIRARDGWFMDRGHTQPLDLVASMVRYQAAVVEAAAEATTGLDFAHRLEAAGVYHRLEAGGSPAIYRGATISGYELEQLRSIGGAVRGRRAVRIGPSRVDLDDGSSLPTAPATVHVDCTAQGLSTAAPRPMWEGDRLTVQFTTLGVAPWSAAIVGHVETLDVDDEERNRLCPVVPRTGLVADQLRICAAGFAAEGVRRASPELAAWSGGARLNPGRAIAEHLDDAEVQDGLGRMLGRLDAAIANLDRHGG